MSAQAAKVKGDEPQGGRGSAFPMFESSNKIFGYPKRFRSFLHEVRVEMKQVTWPSRQDVISTTVVVMATVAFFGVYFFLVDGGIGYMVQQVFKLFKR